MDRSFLRAGAVVTAIGTVVLISGCSTDDSENSAARDHCESTTSLTVAMGHEAPYPGEEALLYAVPKQLGLFDEFCLDVAYQPTGGSSVALQLVEAGEADLGQGNPSALMAAIEKGVNVRGVFNIIPEYGSGLAVLKDSPIASPKDLKGKTIGVSSLSSARLMDAQSMVRAAGLQPEVDVTFVAVGTGAQASTALAQGSVDGLYLWDSAYHSIQSAGTELRIIRDVFPGADQQLDFIEYASDTAIAEKGEAIGLLGRAGAMAQEWAREHPEEALDMFYEEFPNARATSDADRATDLSVLEFTIDQFDPEGTAQSGWGEIPESMIAATAAFYAENGLLSKALPVEDYATNEFVQSYNDFTEDDINALSAG